MQKVRFAYNQVFWGKVGINSDITESLSSICVELKTTNSGWQSELVYA